MVPDLFFFKESQNLKYGLLVVLVTFVVYANTLVNGFVWDDNYVILNNPALKGSVLSLFSGIDSARSTEPTPYYRPLTLLTFVLEQRLHGFNPFLVRLFNVLLHSANAFLVYRLACLLIKNRSAALLAGLMFAVHPLHSEAVDFNSARNTLLAVFFVLTSYLVHEHCLKINNNGGAVAGALLFLCGLFSKEIAIGGLLFVIALEISSNRGIQQQRLKIVYRLMPYLLCMLLYLFLRNHALANVGVSVSIFPGLGERLLNNIYIIPKYMLTVLFPASLNNVYFIPDDLHQMVLPLLVAWLGIISTFVWLVTKGRSHTTLFGLAWLFIFWLPVSGLIPIPSAALADRYLYLPAIGLWLIVADQTNLWLIRRNGVRRFHVAAVICILVILATLTVRRNFDWKSEITLFSRFVEVFPDRAYGYHNLACYYMDTLKNLDRAEQYFEKALQVDPSFPRLHTQFGYLRLQRGDYPGALAHYDAAIRLNSNDAEAHLNSGVALEQMLRFEEAVARYRIFLSIPDKELAGSRAVAEAKVILLSRK